MHLSEMLKQYWPLLLLLAWFGYKWWSARRVHALLPTLRKQGAVVVDVRSREEFAAGSAPDTINIPLQELGGRRTEIAQNVPVVLCCASGTRSAMAAALLRRHGFGQVYNAGGWQSLLQ